MKKIVLIEWSLFFLLILLIPTITVQTGCANIVPPSGGLRDSIPPVLVKALPKDSTRNFQGSRINLTFDEYIDIDNFQQNVIITPIPKTIPGETHKLNTISIRLRDSLESNTTYTINFGNAIKDVNEGNIMKNFSYVFSTGPYLDSLTLSGSVIIAETGKSDSTLIVMLHRHGDDSAVVKEKPRYVSKLDAKGSFTFHNLPSGTYYLYALKDDSRQYRYMNNRSLFAFADSPVVMKPNMPLITLYAYVADKSAPAGIAAAAPAAGKPADKRIKFQTSLQPGKTQDLLQSFSFSFERALKKFDSAKVHFSSDSSYTPIMNYTWTVEKKKAILTYPWKENTLYHLVIEKDFAIDTLNQQLLRADTISFKTLKNSDYGKLSIRFRNLDLSKNPVLQFVQNSEVVSSFSLSGETFAKALFLPGEYQLRILNDANKNGKWDAGEFYGKHRQPEIVKPVDRQVTVKPNWENELEITL